MDMITNIILGFPRKTLLINKMAEANHDDTELEELGREREAERAEDQGEEDTSFNEERPGDNSILIIDSSNPMFIRPEGPSTSSNIPGTGRDAGVMWRYIIHDKKQFLKKRTWNNCQQG